MAVQRIASLTILFVIALVVSQECEYEKFTPVHSYCQPRNPNCRIDDAGLTTDEENELVKAHNEFRSKVAMGKETAAGGLPPAADMLKMEWDDELAVVAQKRAEQCKFRHDCNQCRQVDRFPNVGQNLFFNLELPGRPRVSMKAAVRAWYNEVQDFSGEQVSNFHSNSRLGVNRFSQVIWSSSWKLGCGAVRYKEGSMNNFLLVCNYGPGGNIIGSPIYKTGEACSSCPKNSECGEMGLCEMLSSSDR